MVWSEMAILTFESDGELIGRLSLIGNDDFNQPAIGRRLMGLTIRSCLRLLLQPVPRILLLRPPRIQK